MPNLTMTSQTYLEIFEALSHATRWIVFELIYRAGDAGVKPKEIIADLNVDSGTLDFHLKKLVAARLIRLKMDGKRGIYCLSENIPHGLTYFFALPNADQVSQVMSPPSLGFSKMASLH